MTFHNVVDISELIKYLNQRDIYRLSQVNHTFYNDVKPYLVKIHDWIDQRCVEFIFIYQVGMKTKTDKKYLSSLDRPYFYDEYNIFSKLRYFPIKLDKVFNVKSIQGIKNGDTINIHRLKKGKLKYRITYIFYNDITYRVNKSNSPIDINNGPSMSITPPHYWSNRLIGGVCYTNDVGVLVDESTLEYSISLGCRYLAKALSGKRTKKWRLHYIEPNNNIKFNFTFPITSLNFIVDGIISD